MTSDYKTGHPLRITYGLPHICDVYGDPARASVADDRLTMEIALPTAYPRAWVATDGFWNLVAFETPSEGRIIGGLFRDEWVTVASKTVHSTGD